MGGAGEDFFGWTSCLNGTRFSFPARHPTLPQDLLWLQTFPLLMAPNSPCSACPGLFVKPYLDIKSLTSSSSEPNLRLPWR